MKMTLTEISILLLLLVMTVPTICRKLGKPSIIYAVYLICGMLFTPLLMPDVRHALRVIGEIGFILLLFEIGLEIDIPRWSMMIGPIWRAAWWTAIQLPLLLTAAYFCGLPLTEGLVAAFGFCGCSVGIAFQGWYHYPSVTSQAKMSLLHWMIALEVGAMIILSTGQSLFVNGFGFKLLLNIGGIVITIALISVFGDKVAAKVAFFSRTTMQWRAHFWILFILAAVSLGHRLGLSSAKAAFFLGLAISRTTHEGLALEHHLRPISQHLLIPVFFVSLGAAVAPSDWVSWVGFSALATAIIILLFRRLIARRIPKDVGGAQPDLLVSPSLTIAAIVAEILTTSGAAPAHIAWILMISTTITLYSVLAIKVAPQLSSQPHKA